MPEMITISTHQTIGLTSTDYTITTDEGHYLGSYVQDHGSDVVHSGDLPEGDSGVVGPIEAIAAFARAAGIKEWTLSENVTIDCRDFPKNSGAGSTASGTPGTSSNCKHNTVRIITRRA